MFSPQHPAQLLAEAKFDLARALWEQPANRGESLELARAALDLYREVGNHAHETRVVAQWLAGRHP